jgi:hypothetical protein
MFKRFLRYPENAACKRLTNQQINSFLTIKVMGKLFAGPWSDLTGMVGNNVGRYVDGENIFSVKPHKSSKPSSQSQINHRTGFGMMMGQVSLFSGAIAIGLKYKIEKLAPGNAALKYNFKHALSGTAPNYSINYAKFLISSGKLNPVSTPAVAAVAGETATVDFSWLDGGYGQSDPTDLIKVYIHTPGIENLVTN